MALSKPIYNLLGTYFEQLFNHPIRTKSITSCVLATSANYASQKIAGNEEIDQDSLLAYGLFGLLFGGAVPHYFYAIVERFLKRNVRFRQFIFFLIERSIYAPFFQTLSLYFLSRFEGSSNYQAVENLRRLYWPLLKANWKYLSIPVFINIYFVPPLLRVLTSNLIGFIWVIFMANRRRAAASRQQAKKIE